MSVLLIRKLEGDFENILVRDANTRVAAHIQIPVGSNIRRVVVAMPAGKAALCFETAQSAGWFMEDDPVTFCEEQGQGGVQFILASNMEELSIPVASILMNHTLMARFGADHESRNESRLKTLIESGAIKTVESKLGMPLHALSDRGKTIGPVCNIQQEVIAFTRRSLDGKHHYQMEFITGQALEIRKSGDHLQISRKKPSDRAPLRLTIRASTDFERLTPMPFNELVNERGRALAGHDPFFAEAIRNYEFLSFGEKFLAGSWNFLSYFGRDTLISLRIMWQVLSRRAKQTGIQSVVNEISEDGVVNVTDEWTDDRTMANAIECFFREYDRNDIERARQIMKTIVDGNVPEHPFLDVLDQTFMFPSATAHWFREMDDACLMKWLKEEHPVLGRTESNLATLLRNWNYLLAAASPYIGAWQNLCAKYPALTPQQIIEIHRNEFRKTYSTLVYSIAGAANWRDTYNLPWHVRSEDINANLLPIAILSIQEIIERISNLDARQDMIDLSRIHSLNIVSRYLHDHALFNTARDAWNWDLMREHFLVHRTSGEIRRDLEHYLEGLKNSNVFGENRERATLERDTLLRCREGGVTVSDFLYSNRVPESLKEGIEFTALIMDPEGCLLPVMHSDDVFLLLFGHPTMEQFRKIVHPLVLSYPFGLGFLDDHLGFAVSSAVYAPRDHLALKDNHKNVWVKFGPDEYHGRAAWPWVLFALISGTYDQVMNGIDAEGQYKNGITPEDAALFRTILSQMKSSIEKLGPLATSEVFGYTPASSGKENWQAIPMGISTPIQLWSAAPAHMLIDEALERMNRHNPLNG